ncbi:MAG: hypothetical protein KA998_04590 [Rickettsiaceae bacterium]|nr:hypothetical protein [Rickettsiaceae bacterium]
MNMKLTKILFFFLSLFIMQASYASKKLPVPRFVSTKSNEVNARSGPGVRYPIDWVFVKKGEPLEITAEFEQWRFVKDIDGQGGWVHSSVLSGKRSVVLISKEIASLYKSPDLSSRVVAKLSPNIRCQFKKCEKNWCKIKCSSHDGWIMKKHLWGTDSDQQDESPKQKEHVKK